MDALVWSAVINGVAAAPIMVMLVKMARERRVMGKFAKRMGHRQAHTPSPEPTPGD